MIKLYHSLELVQAIIYAAVMKNVKIILIVLMVIAVSMWLLKNWKIRCVLRRVLLLIRVVRVIFVILLLVLRAIMSVFQVFFSLILLARSFYEV